MAVSERMMRHLHDAGTEVAAARAGHVAVAARLAHPPHHREVTEEDLLQDPGHGVAIEVLVAGLFVAAFVARVHVILLTVRNARS